ncbi:hypothetical protein B0H66DRAFT_137860 [Apodospora peruviana]|uniref:Granulins domain-containing protein n=1 Tax=Apodospora peruviana TaxID=516989 RepID=A0AAE0MBN4_9PEZI|nr:hypothetical protein B0H66DRAFT_137860 [Apodospora peruviana]
MSNRILIPITYLLSILSWHQGLLVAAQSGAISVGPLLGCDITTFSCPGAIGCCTIGGCCGAGCCANGYACINKGTSSEACCPSFDPTMCGTVSSVGPTLILYPHNRNLHDLVAATGYRIRRGFWWRRRPHMHANPQLQRFFHRSDLDMSLGPDMWVVL